MLMSLIRSIRNNVPHGFYGSCRRGRYVRSVGDETGFGESLGTGDHWRVLATVADVYAAPFSLILEFGMVMDSVRD